jgi:ATPase family associated with various cellular activities (AAA)
MHLDPSSLLLLAVSSSDTTYKKYILAATLIVALAQPLTPRIWQYAKQLFVKNTTYTIETQLRTGAAGVEYIDATDNIISIFYAVSQLSSEIRNQIRSATWFRPLEDMDYISQFLPINDPKGIMLTDDIKLTITLEDISDSKQKTAAYHTKGGDNEKQTEQISRRLMRVKLTTPKSMTHLQAYLEKTLTEYNTFRVAKESEMHIAYPAICMSNRDRVYHFETTKSFDNLFFDGKEEIISRLETFDDWALYERMGIPHTLGFLFHGEPGTGKTSAIKAIAKYTRRSLVIIPMAQVKTRDQLDDIFRTIRIQYKKIPNSKRIYVFEEIDCGGWKDIVVPRCCASTSAGASAAAAPAATAAPEQKQTIIIANSTEKEKEPEAEKLTLGAILETLDGLFEASGRIVIMTTNHPDNLDPALRRPGRIDMEVEFKRLRPDHIAAIYERWYGQQMEPEIIAALPDRRYTQAELSQLLFRYPKDPGGFILAIGPQLQLLSEDVLPLD